MPDGMPDGPVEVAQIEAAVVSILRGAGADPSSSDLGFLRNYVRLGMRHGFRAHEIAVFIARDWPRYRTEDKTKAPHPVAMAIFREAASAANRGQARSTAVYEGWAGYDMAHVAARCDALYKRDG